MQDKIYLALLAISLIFSIPVCLRFPEYSILYSIMIFYFPFALTGLKMYRRSLGKLVPGREVGNQYLYALLGLPLGLLAFLGEWQNLSALVIYGAIVIILVAVAEETFRAGSIVLFSKFLKIDVMWSIFFANLSWILFHFAIRPFNLWYFVFLCIAAVVFTVCLIKGGLGTAVLAHIISNSIASWIVLTTYSVGTATLSYSSLAVLMVIVFAIPILGGLTKWQGR